MCEGILDYDLKRHEQLQKKSDFGLSASFALQPVSLGSSFSVFVALLLIFLVKNKPIFLAVILFCLLVTRGVEASTKSCDFLGVSAGGISDWAQGYSVGLIL